MKTISLNKNNDFYLDDAGNLALSLDTDAMSEISKNIVLISVLCYTCVNCFIYRF